MAHHLEACPLSPSSMLNLTVLVVLHPGGRKMLEIQPLQQA